MRYESAYNSLGEELTISISHHRSYESVSDSAPRHTASPVTVHCGTDQCRDRVGIEYKMLCTKKFVVMFHGISATLNLIEITFRE